jgi:hypothetical protein
VGCDASDRSAVVLRSRRSAHRNQTFGHSVDGFPWDPTEPSQALTLPCDRTRFVSVIAITESGPALLCSALEDNRPFEQTESDFASRLSVMERSRWKRLHPPDAQLAFRSADSDRSLRTEGMTSAP